MGHARIGFVYFRLILQILRLIVGAIVKGRIAVPIPTKHEAHEILGPYHALIWQIVHEAWAEWRTVQKFRVEQGMSVLLYPRSIANYVFDAVARRAIPAFGAEPRITVKIEAQTFKIFVGGLVAARFKQGGEDKLGQNQPTQAALAFMDADGVLPGLPPETAKVEIIWLPNDIRTQIETLLVVARDGDRRVWDYEIEDPREAAEIIPLPIRPTEPPAPEAGDFVKPKADPNAQTEEEE
jgi:hypothetical protein